MVHLPQPAGWLSCSSVPFPLGGECVWYVTCSGRSWGNRDKCSGGAILASCFLVTVFRHQDQLPENSENTPPTNKFKKNLLINCNHATQRKALLIILVYTPSFLYVMQIQIILYFSKYSYFFSLNTILQNLSFLYHYSIL